MEFNDCVRKLERYFSSNSGESVVVDVPNPAIRNALLSHFNVKGNTILPSSEFCNKDEFPSLDLAYSRIRNTSDNVIVTGLTSFLKLYGKDSLKQQLVNLLSMSIKGHAVILSYQCADILCLKDPRLIRRILVVDGQRGDKPNLTFVSNELHYDTTKIDADGLDQLGELIEKTTKDRIYIRTTKRQSSFPYSLYEIRDLNKSYDVLCHRDEKTRMLNENMGSEAQWAYALSKLPNGKKWEDVASIEFGSYNNLDFVINNYNSLDSNRKWFYYIMLRLFGAKNNWCLDSASRFSVKEDDLVKMIYRSIADVNYNNPHFWEMYESRKQVLNAIGNPTKEAVDFTNWIKIKGKDAIYYLTDNTQIEKERIFSVLDQFGDTFDRTELEDILKHIYPALYDYLSPFHFEHELLNDYFQTYKYEKIINKIYPEFQAIVDEQAKKREFNLLLPARSMKVSAINKKNSELFFMDAMGVEYLGYIMKNLQNMGLKAKVTVCRCNLPSITECNKEFVKDFEDAGLPVSDIKELDEIKHKGKKEYDYSKTKLPIHLIKELTIIDELIENIYIKLNTGEIQKGIVISDHGASRLAVIKEDDLSIDVNSKGTHGGRVCEYTEEVESIPDATREGDYYILANYSRFKGGRAPSVETHGGATLEEVVVPIIEITLNNNDYEISLIQRIISVSFRKKAALDIFSKTQIDNPKICINNAFYDMSQKEDGVYHVEMPDIKKSGKYSLDVYSGDNLIASELEFEVRKESSSERDLFA